MAFASNLLGAMVGGAIEYVALVTGYQALLLLVAVLYALAWLFANRWRGCSPTRTSSLRHCWPATTGRRHGRRDVMSAAGVARGHMVAGGRGAPVGGASMSRHADPRERRGTVRRIVAFFRPYRRRVVVMVSIVVTSFLGIINPYLLKLLIDVAIPPGLPAAEHRRGTDDHPAHHQRTHRRRPGLPQQHRRPARHAGPARRAVRAPPAHAAAVLHRDADRQIQSRLANDVGGVQGVVTDTASSVFSNPST